MTFVASARVVALALAVGVRFNDPLLCAVCFDSVHPFCCVHFALTVSGVRFLDPFAVRVWLWPCSALGSWTRLLCAFGFCSVRRSVLGLLCCVDAGEALWQQQLQHEQHVCYREVSVTQSRVLHAMTQLVIHKVCVEVNRVRTKWHDSQLFCMLSLK